MPEKKQPSKTPAKKAAPKKAAAKKAPAKVEPVVEEPKQAVNETVEPAPSKEEPKASKTGLVLHLVGHDGNAFSILNRAHRVLIRGGKEDLWEDFQAEATSGDYDNLLNVCREYFDVPLSEKGTG